MEKIRHRGPDGYGEWVNEQRSAGLAHRRLAMVDVENGTQPFLNEDQSVVAVVNGEFYGHQEIRSDLERAGHRFKTSSDSEIVVHLYEQFGLDFVQHLRGEFSILVWDQKLNRLIAARDRFGIKPLVYFSNEYCTGFASEAKALFAELDSVRWDMESLSYAMTLQYLPPNRTLFESIHKVPPGHIAIVEHGKIELSCYWDLDYPSADNESEISVSYESSVDTTRSLLAKSVIDRIPDEVPCCFHLSGGLDSSAVLGIASHETGKRQTAFTIRCPGDGYDEFKFAQSAANFCNAELVCFEFSQQHYVDAIFDAARASEGLAINGHLPAKHLLNKEINSRGFKAVLTGEGADETFLGYTHLRLDFERSLSVSNQYPIPSEDQASLGMMLPMGESLSMVDMESQMGFVPTFLTAKSTLGHRIHSLLSDDARQVVKSCRPFSKIATSSPQSQLKRKHPVHQSSWLWSRWAMAGYILNTLGDGTEMPSSIEGRTPFLDHHLFEHVRQLPLNYFFRNGAVKQLLRDAAEPYVTPEIHTRVKHPFDTSPFLLGNASVATNFLRDQTDSDAFRAQPFFSANKVNNLLDSVKTMNPLQQQMWDPVVTLMCTVLGIQELMD